MIVVIIVFLSSVICTLACVPMLAILARKIGLVDHPDGQRKLHTASIPMVGGIAVFLTLVLVVPVAIFVGVTYQPFFISVGNGLLGWLPIDFEHRTIRFDTGNGARELAGLLIGSTILVIVGILDDRFGIRGRQKLLGQFIATTVLILFGYNFDKLFGMEIEFTVISLLFVYAWVIGAINSVNLLDGADGIASTIGIVMSLALSVMAVYQGHMITAIIAVSMAGALLGFLRFNFPPAKAYLGDTGSMLIGFVLSALAILCTLKQNTAVAFFAPIALLAIPFLDSGAAIIRRRLTGRSVFAVDRGHLHHTLMKRGYSPKVSLLWVALLCTTTAAGGVLSLLYGEIGYALISIAIVIIVMIGCKIFGVAEYQLISRKATSVAMSFFRMASKNAPDVQQSSVHVQGSRDWQDAWKLLCDFADSHELIEITMDLNAPWLHESFHATRRRSDIARGDNHAWYSQIPIITGGRVFGRIEILVSGTDDESHHGLLRNLLVVTAEVEYSVAESIRESIYTRVDGEKDPAGANGVVEETTVEPGSPVDGAVAKSLPMDADPDVSGSTASAN